MADKKNERSIAVTPDTASISEVSDFFDNCLEEFMIPLRVGYSLKVVTDEIYSNIVYYSGANKAEILFRNDTDNITLIFQDDGKPYNPLEAEEPDMVKKMAESVQYEYAAGRNCMIVILSKRPKKKKMTLEDFDL